MALICNGSNQLSGINRMFGAVGASGLRSVFESGGVKKNFDSGEHAVSGVTNKAAIPEGTRHPFSWKMGTKAGSLSSHIDASLTISGQATGLRGVTADATASIAFTVADAEGQLISSGEGTAAMTFAVADALLTASLNGDGEASFTITTNTPLLGAEASGVGTASFTITGALTPYAIGNMVGTTEVATDIVNANIVSVNGYSVTGNGQSGSEWGPA
jgi:hypothetical protein